MDLACPCDLYPRLKQWYCSPCWPLLLRANARIRQAVARCQS